MVRVPAVWSGAVHRPRPELAPFVHLMAERADDRELRKILRPRRLAHANLFVSDYEKAADFYSRVAGFEEVYRQPDNRAGGKGRCVYAWRCRAGGLRF